jgi:hypothetical protein
MVKTLFTNGDSWTFGSEIMAPEFCVAPGEKGTGMAGRYKSGCDDYHEYNDYYRIPRIWPTVLGKLMDAEVINLARPARSNDTIVEDTTNWILENYIIPGKSTQDLTVVIGWSSPERKNIILEETTDEIHRFTLWPGMRDDSFYPTPGAKKLFKFYVTYLWLEQEYIKRYVEQNYQFQNFCKSYGIEHYVFNAFHAQPHLGGPEVWSDLKIKDSINSWDKLIDTWADGSYNWSSLKRGLCNQWDQVSIKNFVNKDGHSFCSYIHEVVPKEIRMNNWHPSPESHSVWANYLYKWMKNA